MSTINRYKLSVIIPGIRPERWTALYDSLKLAIGDNTWEALFVGPKCPDGSLPDVTNVRFIQDRGCPSRAFQIGVSLAEGEYICFGTDDAVAVPGTLDECLKIVTNTNVPVDIVITTYVEGANVFVTIFRHSSNVPGTATASSVPKQIYSPSANDTPI
jgi:hypothetical protein